MFVDPIARARAIGQAIWKRSRHARQEGVELIQLETGIDNLAALRLYSTARLSGPWTIRGLPG